MNPLAWQRCSLGLMILLVLVQVLVLLYPVEGYNLDQEHSLVFNGPKSSMFGYSVLLYHSGSHSWLVVGAPVGNSSFPPPAVSPGALYRCRVSATPSSCEQMYADVGSCGKTCQAESDNQWLGVSLSRQPRNKGGDILACAHRWKNVYHSKKDSTNNKLPNGICYRFSDVMAYPQPFLPCYRDHQRRFGEDYGSCQAGISNFLTEDLIITGAPGTSYWTGSVVVYNKTSSVMSSYLDLDTGVVSFGSYLGYSVGAGHFLSPSSTEVVGGAPQYNQKGKVFIFSAEKALLQVVSSVSGKELGSYFGSSVCVVDLNADGLSDLLVGAPLAVGAARDEGRVHVYINQGEAKLLEAEFHLTGSNAYAARFGETITDLGDLDDDGYPDVAIGAPHEDDLKGAIYIYNGRQEGISPTPSQRITGSILGHRLNMFGQSLNSGIDIDNNGYQDVAVGAFLSDSAVILRTRPVIRVEATLTLPEQIDQRLALCRQHHTPTVCFNVTVCFSVSSRQYKGAIDLNYNLTSDLHHKPFFPHRFYFHGNGTSNITRGHVRARNGQITCTTHRVFQRKDVRDIYTPVWFEVSYGLKETHTNRTSAKAFPPLKPILQQRAGHRNAVSNLLQSKTNTNSNKTQFARSCSQVNCSTNMQLSAQIVLPQQLQYYALGSGRTMMLNASLLNSGDDAFLPRLMLRFPDNIHYIKVLQNEDNTVSCDVTQEVNSTMVGVICSASSFLLPAQAQMNISFLLDVSQNSTPGDIIIYANTSSDNYESADYLHDNWVTLSLPLRYGVNVNIHGFVNPTSFSFEEVDSTPVDCYTETFNYTYKVLNSGPSRSVDTVVDIALPKILAPYHHRLLQVVDWQTSQGVCSMSDTTISVIEDCDAPKASFIKQLIFFFSPVSTRRMFCSRRDHLCEWLVCRLGNLEAGREATIRLEARLNPAVLLQAPGRQGIMTLESIAMMSSPREDPNTTIIHEHPLAQVLVEAHFSQKPSTVVKVFIIIISLVLGLMILAALIWCLWKAGFFKRTVQKTEEEFKRDSWDYVPQSNKRESFS